MLPIPEPLLSRKQPPSVPSDLTEALERAPEAARVFTQHTPSEQEDYIEFLEIGVDPAERTERLRLIIQALEKQEGLPMR